MVNGGQSSAEGTGITSRAGMSLNLEPRGLHTECLDGLGHFYLRRFLLVFFFFEVTVAEKVC